MAVAATAAATATGPAATPMGQAMAPLVAANDDAVAPPPGLTGAPPGPAGVEAGARRGRLRGPCRLKNEHIAAVHLNSVVRAHTFPRVHPCL